MDEPTPHPAATPHHDIVEQPAAVDGFAPGVTVVRRVRGPRRWPGIVSGVFALLMLASTAVGIQLASRNELLVASYAAYAAIAFSVFALVFGVVAIAKRWGRGAGIAGAVVAVLGNPLVLLYGLSGLGGS